MATTRNSLLTAFVLAVSTWAASAQTAPSAVPVPFSSLVAGGAGTACAMAIASTDGTAYGDACPAAQSKLAAPQGAAVDGYGNQYIGDYTDHLVRVVYNGNPLLAAAIKAANSGFSIGFGGQAARSAPAPTPVVGNIYTIAGVGNNTTTTAYTYVALTVKNTDGNFACANVAGNPDALNNFGDGCPAAAATVGPRDVKVDADGNLFIVDYTNSRVRVLCVNCYATSAAYKAVQLAHGSAVTPTNGAMYTIAGFSVGYRDASPGFVPAGDVSGTTAATATTAQFRTPTGIAISASDDLYIADNLNNALRLYYNGGTTAKNILAAQGTAAPTIGYVYTIAGSGCVSAAAGKTGSVATANACLNTPGSDTPALGFASGAGVGTGPVWSTYLDSNGNVFYTDATNNRVKVIYGGVMAPITLSGTLNVGYTYSFAGQGTGVADTQNGVAPSALVFGSAGTQSVGGDPYGNIFFFDYSAGLLYEVYASSGIAAVIGGSSTLATTPAVGAYCNGLVSGPQMTDTSYDGCPTTQVKFASTRGPIVADSVGNLYFGDSVGNLFRKLSYNPTFASTAVASTTGPQAYAFTFLANSALSSTSIKAGLSASSDFADAGGDTCSSALTIAVGVPGTTCVVNVNFTPKSVGPRPASVVLSGSAGILGQSYVEGTGLGSALALDPATFTTTGSGITPAGVAVDAAAANVYVTDTTGKKAVRYAGATATTIATGFQTPSGIAVDTAGNVFIADAAANTVTAVPNTGAQYLMASVLSGPRQVTTDALGRIYVADGGNNRVVVFSAGGGKAFSVLPFTGLSAPSGVAVDSAFNVYAADLTHIVKLTPLGVQTTVATQSGLTGLAVDAAGNLYSGSTTTMLQFNPAGTRTTLYSTLGNANSVAIDGTGNLYVADSGTGGYDLLARTSGYYKFTGTSGSTQIQLTSIGTASVSTTAYTQTDSTDYTLTPATTNGCSGALAAGSYCLINAAYLPLAPGILTDTVSFTAPVSNGSPSFTLVNVSLIPAITLKAASATLTYGQSQTLSATVYGTGNNNGTVNFYNNGTTLIGSKAVDTNGLASYVYTPAVGTYSVTATYTPTGATAPTVTSTPAVAYTVTQATPSVTVAATPTSGYATTTYTITATVASTSTTPTGSVTFYIGSTPVLLGTAPVNSGVATFTTSSLPVGTDCITASYSGDVNYAAVPASTVCTNILVSPGFGVTASASTLSYQTNYQEAQSTLNIVTGGRTDTLTFACTGLPAKTACNFSPSSVTLAGGTATVQVQMLVANSSATYGALHTEQLVTYALAPFAALVLFGLRRRKRVATLLLIAFALLGAASLSGCSGQDPTTLNLASGSYNFNVAVNSGSTTLQTVPFTLKVP